MKISNKTTFIIYVNNTNFMLKCIKDSNNDSITIPYDDYKKWKNKLDFMNLFEVLDFNNEEENNLFNYYIKTILNMYIIRKTRKLIANNFYTIIKYLIIKFKTRILIGFFKLEHICYTNIPK